jgi:hypothetical protein
MRIRYLRLTTVMLFFVCLGWAVPKALTIASQDNKATSPLLMTAQDSETVLALGLRMPLGCTDLWALELIPNLSGSVAERLIAQKEGILAAARRTAPSHALQSVFGVGEATARRLLEYVAITDNCRTEQGPYTRNSNNASAQR